MERICIKCRELGFIVISAPEPGFGVYIFTFLIIETHLQIHTLHFFKHRIDLTNCGVPEPNDYT
jgi:hypothetical protein